VCVCVCVLLQAKLRYWCKWFCSCSLWKPFRLSSTLARHDGHTIVSVNVYHVEEAQLRHGLLRNILLAKET
jgi:hypothetical protein